MHVEFYMLVADSGLGANLGDLGFRVSVLILVAGKRRALFVPRGLRGAVLLFLLLA